MKQLFISLIFVFSHLCLSATDMQPNVVLIMLDDLNDYSGFLGGHPQAQTPNMDALASQSIIFTNAHTNAPICAPSRASLFTGIYPHVSEHYWFDKWYENDVLKNGMSLPEYLKANGYATYGTGKLMHHNVVSHWTEYGVSNNFGPYPYNGSKRVGHPSVPLPYREIGFNDATYASLADVPNVPVSDDAAGYNGWYDFANKKAFRYVNDDDRDLMNDELQAQWAVDKVNFLEAQKDDEPFFLAVGISNPHTPLVAPQKYFDLYPLESLILPTVKEGDRSDCFYRESFIGYKPSWLSHYQDLEASYPDNVEEGLRHYVQAYLACVSFADAQVGKVLDALNSSRFADNTMVILVSDHGYNHGEKEYLYKNALWEESTRIPFLVSTPNLGVNAGHRVNQPISLIDVFPTIKDWCKLNTSTKLNAQGKDLNGYSVLPLVEGKEWEGPQVALTHARNAKGDEQSFSVRSRTMRYTRYYNGQEELYDHTQDEYEWNNLYNDSAYQSTKDSLSHEMDALLSKDYTSMNTGPSTDALFFAYPNPAEDLVYVNSLLPSNSTLNIYNLQGQILCHHQLETGLNTVDVSSYHKGMYLFSVADNFQLTRQRVLLN